MSSLASTEKKRRVILGVLLLAVLAAVVILAGILLLTPKQPESNSAIATPRSESVKGAAGGEGSEEYNRKLEQHDAQKANAALTAGESFIPTPVGNKSPLVMPKASTPPPSPVVAQPRVAPVQPPRNDGLLKRMMEDLAALDGKLTAVSSGTGNIMYEYDFSKDARAVPAVEENISPETAAAPVISVKPGDMLYAVVETGVNSDVPSAVMATVAVGKYKGARLLGKFQRFEERLVLAFSQAILPSGENFQIEAYAVDPSTSEASVATSVDTHFFSRWGGLVAAAFLEGLGTAKRYSGAQSTLYGAAAETADQMVWSTYSPADQAWIAAGKVGEKVGKVFERNFERPPTVYLEQGTPVGVLILSVQAR